MCFISVRLQILAEYRNWTERTTNLRQKNIFSVLTRLLTSFTKPNMYRTYVHIACKATVSFLFASRVKNTNKRRLATRIKMFV
jgi:hypothetical protein